MLFERERENELTRKRRKGVDTYLDFDVHYDGVAIKALKSLCSPLSRESAELCMFDAVAKSRWIHRRENSHETGW